MINPYTPMTPEQRTANDYPAWIENEAYLAHQEKELMEREAWAKRSALDADQDGESCCEENQ